jgi:CHAT domain-containing protein
MTRKDHQQSAVRRYLLKQLSGEEQSALEARLLTEDDFFTELEIVEDELIDDYLANELSRDERKRFEEHFLTTPERESKLSSARAMKRYLDGISPHPQSIWDKLRRLLKSAGKLIFASPIPVAISILLFAVSGLTVWRVAFYRSDLDKGLIALNEAYKQERPIEARLSLLDHAPFENRRADEPKPVNTLELRRAQVFLIQAEEDQHDAAAYHAVGKLYLLQGEQNKAIQYLERSANLDTKNAQIYADLGAAFLEKGRMELNQRQPGGVDAEDGKSLEYWGRSLEYLKRALEIDPGMLEPLFNRGLVHEYQRLTESAKADWRAYLERDPNSAWAAEARNHLKKLEESENRSAQNSGDSSDLFIQAYRAADDTTAWEIYKSNHDSSGNNVTNTLIDHFLAEDTRAAANSENLRALIYLGQLELRKANDAYTSDLAKSYSSAPPQTRALLAMARQEATKGYKLLGQSQISEATKYLASARTTFERVGNLTEALAVDMAIAHGAAVQPDLPRGKELLSRIVRTCEAKRYKWLLAEALTHLSHIETNWNNYSEAITDSNHALQIFQELQDSSSTFGALVQIAGLYLYLKDNQLSLQFLRRAMAIAQVERPSPMKLWGVHITVSLNLSELGLYRAALDYQIEALQLALQSGRRLYISRSYQFVGLTYGSLKQFDLALQNVHNSYEQGREIAAEPNGENMMASASLKLGDLYRLSGDQTSALAAYEESLHLYGKIDFAAFSYSAHKGKFLSYLAQNNDSLASHELEIVFRLFAEYREKIRGERQKDFFFDREQDTCDLAIGFTYFRLGDHNRAFDYSETCRARNLRELMSRGAEVTATAGGLDLQARSGAAVDSLPPRATEIAGQLPQEIQLIEYAVLDNKLVMWLITRSGIVPESVDIQSSKLTELVAATLKQIKGRDDKPARQSLKDLYTLLIEPVRERLDPGKVICFVPDKTLHYVPFSALISTTSDRYLVEDYQVMVSPSAAILINSTNKAMAFPAEQEERLLAVGNPAFDRTETPNLSNLPEAEREVEGFVSDYPLHRVLVRRQATVRAVTEELHRANVAHFATHYQIDPTSTLSSRLLLAPEVGNWSHTQLSGLDSGTIYQMDLAHVRLVILAACQTGIEQQFGGEGPIGFARSFLVAGVPVVVASLWPVDSDSTAELMIAFHRERRREHRRATVALARAQQEMMAHENHRSPYYWAGFTLIGGYSQF